MHAFAYAQQMDACAYKYKNTRTTDGRVRANMTEACTSARQGLFAEMSDFLVFQENKRS